MRAAAMKAGGAILAVIALITMSVGQGAAADLGIETAPVYASYGVDCNGPEAQSFVSVWLGHFTGGASQYTGVGGQTLLDWRDEKLCFPSHRSCDLWVMGMRRDFHHPEGYFTCLSIR